MPWVFFPPQLAQRWPELKDAQFPGATVAEVFGHMERAYPGLSSALLEPSGALRQEVVALIGGRPLQDREGLSDPVGEEDDLYIFPRRG